MGNRAAKMLIDRLESEEEHDEEENYKEVVKPI
jgi:LacI family transcriptional regulator